MTQVQFDFSAPKEIHYVVKYDYTLKKFSIDWDITKNTFGYAQVYDGSSWREVDEEDSFDVVTTRLENVLEEPKMGPRPPIERNVVAIGRRSPKTSQIAAERVLPRTGTKRKHVYDLIKQAGERGLCDHEIEQITGWLHQSASSIRNGLMNDGWIKDSGLRRNTPQSNKAIAWVVA